MILLLIAVIVPLLTLATLGRSGTALHIAAWAVTIIASCGFITAFTVVDIRRRSKGSYADKPELVTGLRIAAAVILIVVSALHAYPVADVIARSDFFA